MKKLRRILMQAGRLPTRKLMATLTLALTLTLAAGAVAQTSPDFREQYAKLHQAYVKNPDDVANLVAMAQYFAQSDNPQYDIVQAARHIHQAESLITRYLEDNSYYRELLRLMRQDISLLSIREQRRAIDSTAYSHFRQHAAELGESELATFAEVFADHKGIYSRVSSLWQQKAYNRVKQENTIDAYYEFLAVHAETPYADSAESALTRLAPDYYLHYHNEADIIIAAERYPDSRAMQHAAMLQCSRLAFADARRLNTLGAYNAYIERFPQGENYLDALVEIEELNAEEFSTLATPADYAEFALHHSDNAYADSAVAQLRNMILVEHNAVAAKTYLDLFPLDPYYSSIYKEYYRWHAFEGNEAPLRHFADENPNFPYRIALETDLARARGIDTIDLRQPFVEADADEMSTNIYKLTGKGVAFVALQRILQQQIARRDWRGAMARWQHFAICFEEVSNKEYTELGTLLSAPAVGEVRTEMPADDMLRAVPAADGHALYFTYCRDGVLHNGYATPSARQNVRWDYVADIRMDADNVTIYNLYGDGRQALVGVEGDIWRATVVNDSVWQLEEHLPYPVNTEATEVDAYMLGDGSGILLASDRRGGMNRQASGEYYHGDTALATDLYFIPYNAGGWDTAIHLGMPVNTGYSERSPLLSRNMRTLYYITDGRAGLGYGDIYAVSRTTTDDWKHWGEPHNLGKAVNSPWNEAAIAFGEGEERLYITAATGGGDRYLCFSTATNHDTASPLQYIDINADDVGEALREIDIFDLSVQPMATQISTQVHTKVQIDKNHRHAVMAYAQGLFVPAVMLTAPPPAIVAVKGYTPRQLLEMAAPVPLTSVSFVANTARLTAISEHELRQLALFLIDNDTLDVQINTYADGVDDRKCYDLSVRRATAVRTQLASYGVGTHRVRLAPYGNSRSKTAAHPYAVGIQFFEQQ